MNVFEFDADSGIDGVLDQAREVGAKFYAEVASDGVFLRTTEDNKLVVKFSRDDELTFYDRDEVDIYHINEANEHMEHDSGHINMLLDAAWGEAGFGEKCEAELGAVLQAIAQLAFLNDSEEGFDDGL